MKKNSVITYNFGSDLIERVADILYNDFYKKGKSLDRVACVFGGKRPALFLKKSLSKKIKLSFLPPAIFSMDEFIHHIAFSNKTVPKISNLELYYLIYRLAKDKLHFADKKRVEFSQFLSWSKEIVSFIEQLDLEDIDNQLLLDIQKSASIGYEIPLSVNQLLRNIISIRKGYHDFLSEKKVFSRGMVYLKAAKSIERLDFSEFDKIFFCNLYHLHKTEKKILKALYKTEKCVFIFEGSAKRWPILKENSELFTQSIEPVNKKSDPAQLNFYEGFDTQSQVCLVRELLHKIKNKSSTLILLPRPETLAPLLAEVGQEIDQFNVSLGYPLSRSSLYALFSYLFQAHQSRRGRNYYSRDYLGVIKHPFIKNMPIVKEALPSRILAHKIEEALSGGFKSSLSGSLFFSLKDLERDQKIKNACQKTLSSLDYDLKSADYFLIIEQMHSLFFRNWEKVNSLRKFSQSLEAVLDSLSERGLLLNFPLERKALDVMYEIKEELASLSFADSVFSLEQIWSIFKQQLDSARISFIGSPLKGVQILGLLETRSLQFENVLVLDANEGVLPKLKVAEPLIPSEVMLSLGLGRLKKTEEVQRYHFMRLVESAARVDLIWAKNQTLEKSRFVESIIWNKQKKGIKIDSSLIPKTSFSLSFPQPQAGVKKTKEVIEYLRNCVYSVSRINTYLECPLQFYYRYVLGLGKKEDLLEGVKDFQIGNFIHQLLFELYSKFLGKKPVFDQKFKDYFKKEFALKYEKEIKPRMHSDHFLLRGIIEARLLKFLEEEKNREADILKIEALEKEYTDTLDLENLTLNFKYIVDRIDLCRSNQLSLIDYKTGAKDIIPRRLSSLEKIGPDRRQIRDSIKSFQLPVYSVLLQKKFKDKNVNAYVYNLRTAEKISFPALVDHSQKEKVLDVCLKALKFIVSQIFDPNVLFEADQDLRRCSYCDFRNLCR